MASRRGGSSLIRSFAQHDPMRDVITRFDDYVRAVGDPEPPSAPVTLRAAARYLFRRAVPALVPVAVAVVGQFFFTGRTSGVLTALGVGAAMAAGVAGAAAGLSRRGSALAAALLATGLLVGPPYVIADGGDGLFAVHTALFGVVSLLITAICYAETAGLSRPDDG